MPQMTGSPIPPVRGLRGVHTCMYCTALHYIDACAGWYDVVCLGVMSGCGTSRIGCSYKTGAAASHGSIDIKSLLFSMNIARTQPTGRVGCQRSSGVRHRASDVFLI